MVIVISDNLEFLGNFIEFILSLIFPFEYQCLCIPILPISMIDILETNLPCFIGIKKSLFKKFSSKISTNVYVVNLDTHKVTIIHKNDLCASEKKNKRRNIKLSQFPEVDRLTQSISQFFSKSLKTESLKIIEKNIKVIRKSFFNFFAYIMSHYDESIEHIDNIKDSHIEIEFVIFFQKFCKTLIFKSWKASKQIPKDNIRAHDLLLFEEEIKTHKMSPKQIKAIFEIILEFAFYKRKREVRKQNFNRS